MGKAALIPALLLAGCANFNSSHVMLGTAGPPLDPSNVRIFVRPPASYEEIALVMADSRGSFRWSSQGTTDLALERLKQEAATLGADGLLNLRLGEPYASPATLGTGVGYGWGAPISGYGVGAAIDVPAPFKTASAIAIRTRRQ